MSPHRRGHEALASTLLRGRNLVFLTIREIRTTKPDETKKGRSKTRAKFFYTSVPANGIEWNIKAATKGTLCVYVIGRAQAGVYMG